MDFVRWFCLEFEALTEIIVIVICVVAVLMVLVSNMMDVEKRKK